MLRLEDLYLPFKPKKKSLARGTRKGAGAARPGDLAQRSAVANLEELLPSLVNPEKHLNAVEEVKPACKHILAEMINETAELRAQVRRVLWKTGVIASAKNEKAPEGQGNEFKPYFQFKEPAQDIRPHRILALNRGEKEGVLKVKLEWPVEAVQQTALGVLAEHLLHMAGKMPQSVTPAAQAAGEPGEPVGPPPETPPVETPPEAARRWKRPPKCRRWNRRPNRSPLARRRLRPPRRWWIR